MANSSKPTPPVNPNPDWQDRDINLTMLLAILGGIIVTVVASFIGMGMLMKHYQVRETAKDQPVSVLATTRQLPDGPMLQVNPPEELAAHLAGQRALISGYGWINESTGIAQIPIDRAMAIVAEKGVPKFAPVGVKE